jgi:DNA polymerase (family 10)
MDKEQVAAILDEIGTLLALQGENDFKVRAYHNAARTIEQLEGDLDQLVADGGLGELPGIGETLREKITLLVTEDSLPYYDKLKAETPEGLLDMLRIQGLGPKKVRALYEQLGIDSLDKLRAACESGEVAKLKGFGAKTQQNILDGLEFLAQMGARVRIDQALPLAHMLVEGIKNLPGIQRMAVCGSLRRRKETVKDIDILVSADDAGPIMERFVSLPCVLQVIGQGDTKSSVIVGFGDGSSRVVMNADLRVVEDRYFAFALHHFTGSKEHNVALRQRAIEHGLKMSEYGLEGESRSVECKDESEIYAALGLTYIPPELRELTGEIEVSESGKLPELVEVEDIQGVFHNHTSFESGGSDGHNTLAEMAEATRALGLTYLGIADHSQSLTVANGLSVERVEAQWAEIDRLNKKFRGFRIFKGIESDILADGSLDYDDKILAGFDYVVASIHTHFKMSREEMTARICKALSNPYVTMLGHATGRLLLKRDGYAVDLEEVLQAAARYNVMVEINAHPQRLDLDWIHCKRAKALGVQLVINPDAHSTGDLALYRFGVDVARRGWLEKGDVFNTRSLAEVTKALEARRKR